MGRPGRGERLFPRRAPEDRQRRRKTGRQVREIREAAAPVPAIPRCTVSAIGTRAPRDPQLPRPGTQGPELGVELDDPAHAPALLRSPRAFTRNHRAHRVRQSGHSSPPGGSPSNPPCLPGEGRIHLPPAAVLAAPPSRLPTPHPAAFQPAQAPRAGGTGGPCGGCRPLERRPAPLASL